jgi:hypothetical protein
MNTRPLLDSAADHLLAYRTLARLIAKTANADFKELSATRWVAELNHDETR